MSGLSDILKSVAPGIATALGGPLAGAAVSFLAGKFGTEATAESVEKAIQGFTAADMVKMKELDYQFKIEMGKQGISIDLAQIGVNTAEAASTNWFVAGWRPFIGWVCGVSLAYVAIVEPIMRFVAVTLFSHKGAFPLIDTSLTMQILIGLLGLGAMRSYEKKTGTEGNR